MARYHLSPKTGMPQKCSATISCPFGSMLTHYDNKVKALKAQEEVNKLKYLDEGLAQVHEKPEPVVNAPRRPSKAEAIQNARRARAEAGNERGTYIRSYLKKISVGEQLKLFSDFKADPIKVIVELDELPLKDDLIVQDGIIYRVTGYSPLRNETHVQPLVATKGREAIQPTGQVLTNYIYSEEGKRAGLKNLTEEEIEDRLARRKALRLEAEIIYKRDEDTLEEVEVETYDYLSSPNVTPEGLDSLLRKHNERLSSISGEQAYHRRVSSMNFVDKAANKLASKGELSPQYIAVLNSAGSTSHPVEVLRKELWEAPKTIAWQNRIIEGELKEFPEELEEPPAPGFWKKLFNGNAEEEYSSDVETYAEEKTRKRQLEDTYQKNSSLLAAYGAYNAGERFRHHVDSKLSFSYGAVAISSIKNLYNSEKILNIEDNVELKRILESHIPEALTVAADPNLDSSDRGRLNTALSNMIGRIEAIRKRSGTLSQMESKKAIEFLELKFGEYS